MLSSTLRRARSRLHHNCNRRSTGGGSLGISYTKNRFAFPNNASTRFVNSHRTVESLPKLGTRMTRISKSLATTLSQNNAYFSTEGEASLTKKSLLFLNSNEELPEIYASPATVLEEVTNEGGISDTIMPLANGCKTIVMSKDGKEEHWYSAAYLDTETKEYFYSGQFDKRITPFYSSEETCVIDGRVYYRSESIANEAACARVLDSLAFHGKDSKINGESANATLDPLRYCVEHPDINRIFGENTGLEITNHRSYAPAYQKNLLSENDKNQPASFPHLEPFNFSSLAKSKPFILHLPKQFLLTGFRKIVGFRRLQNGLSYDVEEKMHENRHVFHATVKDPITNEVFSSGLGKPIDIELRCGVSLATPLHRAEVSILDGKVFYHDPKLAEHAAASRAIDCYIFREEGADTNNPRLCLEDPYTTIEEGISQEIDYTALLVQRNHLSEHEKSKSIPIPDKKSTFSSCTKSHPFLLHVPKSSLEHGFRECYGISTCDAYDVEEKMHENRHVFHATVKDPITNEVFSSGLGRPIDVELRRGASLATPLHRAEVSILDGKVFYHDPKLAEHAAASRAIDCYIFREEGADTNNPRLCLEDPYTTIEEGISQEIDYTALLVQRNHLSEDEKNKSISIPDKKSTFSSCAKSQPFLLHVPKSSFELNTTSDDNLPALTFQFNDKPTKVNNKLSTLGRIAELWTDAADIDSSNGATRSWTTKSTIEYDIENILDWYDRVNLKPQNHQEASALAQLCNKILTALGKRNSELHLDERGSYINVEKNAKIILDKIISLSKNYGDKSFFNADTFNAYINCLSQLDCTRSAKLAKDLLKNMVDKEVCRDMAEAQWSSLFRGTSKFSSRDLPNPNVGTFNAVMALCAMADDKSGVNDVYSLLEVASLDDGEGRSLRPNNDTFKTLLAVNSKIDDRFSFNLATDKIQQLADSTCSEAFIPDADLYSAVFSLTKKSRADSKANRYAKSWEGEWLRYGCQYEGGFKSVDEFSNTEAMDMEKWLLYAEDCGVNPNVEMYEAVIQAWTETGTKHGLLKAEEWATRAVSSSSPIRLKTFHPIIASWALCQSERAPGRVKEWNRQLAAVSASQPHLKPDLSLLCSQIIAEVSVQSGIMARLGEKKQSSREENSAARSIENDNENAIAMEALFAGAQNCVQFLEEMSLVESQLESPQDTAAYTSMFTHTIRAWGCAARFAHLNMTSESLDESRGVSEMLEIAQLFQSKINGDKSEQQAQHIMHLMGESYAEIASQLYQIDSADEASCRFCENIAHVERMLRNFSQYSRKHFSQNSFTPESKATRHRLYKEILRGCTGVISETDHDHVVRVCNLIMDHLSWQNEQCHDSGGARVEEDITSLYVNIALLMGTVVKSPHERMHVLTTVHDNARQFFAHKRRFRTSSYATVDRSRLMGAMRMAMGGSELTEPFIRNFDEQTPKRRVQEKTAMSYVHEMLRKRKK